MTLKPISVTCPSCGAAISSRSKFCEWCGTQFEDSEPKLLDENGKSYKSLCADCYIPRHKMSFMSVDDIYRTVIENITKVMVNKLMADKVIKIKSNYDTLTDSIIYRGYLDVVLPENQDEKGKYI